MSKPTLRTALFHSALFQKDEITDEPYLQAPPFFESIVSAVAGAREVNLQDPEDADWICDSDDEDRVLSFEELCDPGWYENVFLKPTKFSEDDAEIVIAALRQDCNLGPHEVDRFEYEVLINGGQTLVNRFSSIDPSGLGLLNKFSREFKGDVQQLRALLRLLPKNGQLDLTTGFPSEVPQNVVHKVLRWIQAFPPLHREIVAGATVICSLENCPNKPIRIPGIGYESLGGKIAPVVGFEHPARLTSFPPGTPINEAPVRQQLTSAFRVLVNGEVVQTGKHPKLSVNFACKKFEIENENTNLEIIRQVKTLDRPYGSIEIRTNGGPPNVLETQISRAWWFNVHQMLVFVTQSDQVYSSIHGKLEHVGAITFSNYGIDCAVADDLSKLVINSRGSELLLFVPGDPRATLHVTLGDIPREFWGKILSQQYKAHAGSVQSFQTVTFPPSISETPLSHVRWFDYKQEMRLLKAGIETVGQLLAVTKESAIEISKLRAEDIDGIECEIERLLVREFKSDVTGVLREQIWLELENRGWVAELGPAVEYHLPRIRDEEALGEVRLQNEIVGASFIGEKLALTLKSGLEVVLSPNLEADAVYVQPWTPNSFLERRKISSREDY